MAESRQSSKLAVILHADIAGSTALVQQDEQLAHERIQDTFRRFSKTIDKYHGRVRELRGDALLADFERASDAVSATLAFQAEQSEYIDTLTDSILPIVRVGIAMGEVIIADNTVTGTGVVLAQRVEQLAEPGGVCVTAAIHEALPQRMPFDQKNLGEQQVKGFEEQIRVYAISLSPGASIPGPETPLNSKSESPKLPDKPSIAVLPFNNMSGDPEQDYFSDGITEDITIALSYFTGLFVIARNSAFSYKGQSVDARQVASELGVRYLLEGSVRRMGNRIRITGQLISATTGSHIWAERFDGDLDEIFDLQDEISRKIVGSIMPHIELAEFDRSRRLQSTSLSSYELSLKAKSLIYDSFRTGDADELQIAIDTAHTALGQDDRNTHALWSLCIANLERYLYRWSSYPDEDLNQAFKLAERIVQVDSSNADGHGLLGCVRIYRREFDLAVADFARALSLNPNAAINLFLAAWGESLAGLPTMAREHAELGLRLSPRDMDIWLGTAYLALTQAGFAEQEFVEAMKWGQLSIQLHSKAPIRRALMVACCAYTGDFEQAVRHVDELKLFSPDFIPAILRGDLLLYKMPSHNKLLVEGLRKAGLNE
jgi:TolB-like protein